MVVPDRKGLQEWAAEYYNRAKSDLERTDNCSSSGPANQPGDEIRLTNQRQAAQARFKPTILQSNGDYQVERVRVNQESSESCQSGMTDSPGEVRSPPDLGFEHIRVPSWDPSGSPAGGELPGTAQSNAL